MSTIVLPVNLLDNLRYSESFRASWIFFSTPVDPARLTVQAVNCAGLFFMVVASLIGFAVLPPAIAFATSQTSVFGVASLA